MEVSKSMRNCAFSELLLQNASHNFDIEAVPKSILPAKKYRTNVRECLATKSNHALKIYTKNVRECFATKGNHALRPQALSAALATGLSLQD